VAPGTVQTAAADKPALIWQAAVGTMAPMPRPRFRFRLSTLLWITFAVGCFFWGMGVERWRAYREARESAFNGLGNI